MHSNQQKRSRTKYTRNIRHRTYCEEIKEEDDSDSLNDDSNKSFDALDNHKDVKLIAINKKDITKISNSTLV